MIGLDFEAVYYCDRNARFDNPKCNLDSLRSDLGMTI